MVELGSGCLVMSHGHVGPLPSGLRRERRGQLVARRPRDRRHGARSPETKWQISASASARAPLSRARLSSSADLIPYGLARGNRAELAGLNLRGLRRQRAACGAADAPPRAPLRHGHVPRDGPGAWDLPRAATLRAPRAPRVTTSTLKAIPPASSTARSSRPWRARDSRARRESEHRRVAPPMHGGARRRAVGCAHGTFKPRDVHHAKRKHETCVMRSVVRAQCRGRTTTPRPVARAARVRRRLARLDHQLGESLPE